MPTTTEGGDTALRHPSLGPGTDASGARYAAWFHELDAWTEYWDVFHPETRGRFYFGDGDGEPGLLSSFLPRYRRPAAFGAWVAAALGTAPWDPFSQAIRAPEVASAVTEVDDLLARLFAGHFGNPTDTAVREDYLEAMHRFATDTLPAAPERAALVPEGDHRRRTAGRHTLDGDIMWFCWALQLEAAELVAGPDGETARRTLMMAGVATGCAANFAWRGHRRTRPQYRPDDVTAAHLRRLGRAWADDLDAARREVHALYRIREWGRD
jgi:hypothetical protein